MTAPTREVERFYLVNGKLVQDPNGNLVYFYHFNDACEDYLAQAQELEDCLLDVAFWKEKAKPVCEAVTEQRRRLGRWITNTQREITR